MEESGRRARAAAGLSPGDPERAATAQPDPALLLDSVPEVIARIALDGTWIWVSAAARTLYGRDPEQMIGTSALDLVEPIDRAEAIQRLNRITEAEGNQERITVRVLRGDGGAVWVDSVGRCVRDPGTGELFIATVTREATKRLHAEGLTDRAEERFRALVEWLPAVVYEAETGPDGVFSYVSPQIEGMLGFSAEEWLADDRLWYECIHPDDRDAVLEIEREQEEAARGTDRRHASEYRMVHRDGHTVWCRDVARLYDEPGEPPYWRGVFLDITAERLAHQSLATAHERHRGVVDGLPACVYRAELGMVGRWEFVSSQIEPLLGYTAEEWIADPTLWRASLHGDDRERIELQENSLATAPAGTDVVSEYRLRNRSGSVVWVRDRALVSADAEGRPVIEGILTDISAERAAAFGAEAADVYRLACTDCATTWASDKIEPCRECRGHNVESVSLNAALRDLASSRRRVEGLLAGIQKHLDALGTLHSASARIPADDPRVEGRE
jgi:PAS domain S-box-containing protein